MGHEAVIVSLSIHDKVLLLADVVIDVAVEVDFFRFMYFKKLKEI